MVTVARAALSSLVALPTLAALSAAGLLGLAAPVVEATGLPAGTPAVAAPSATYAPGSTVRVVAHVAGLDAPLTVVPIAGLTRSMANAALARAESTALRRRITLIAKPVHGRRSRTTLVAGRVLTNARPPTLTGPASVATADSPLVRLTLDSTRMAALAVRLTPAATVAPVDATASFTSHLVLNKGYEGSTLDVAHLPISLVTALGRGSAVLPEQPVAATYGRATLAKVILVNTSANRLVLYVRGRAAKTYVVATGQAGYPSPHGSFRVVSREPSPSWYNPHDPWSVGLPDVIGPGLDNPLGTRALQLDSPGILIHGIPLAENATLGQNASHGCVRMSRAEIEDLFPQIPVGTPVLMTA